VSVFGSEAEDPLLEARKATQIGPIPTEKAELFDFPVNWKIIDTFELMGSKIEPFVKNQLSSYYGGQADEEVVDYIMSQIREHQPPTELEQVLVPLMGPRDASAMAIKFWTFLIETTRVV